MDFFLCVFKWSLVTGAAALALRLLRPALDRRYHARWRYWTWLILSCALLLGPAAEHLLSTQTAAAPPLVLEVPQMDVLWQRNTETGPRFQVLPTQSHSAPAAPSEPSPAPELKTQSLALSLDEVLPAIWLAGAALFLLWRLLGTLLFCHKARRWSRQPSEQARQIYTESCAALHIKHPPALLISSPVGSPMMTGLLRPRLYLPAEDWAPQELSFILRHELTHFRRHDLWYKLLVLLANAVHWFNPFIYLLSREADVDLELTCDDAVVANTDRETRQAYSETLLASLHRQKGLSRTALSTHFYGGANVMKDRFRNILTQNKRKFGLTALLLALLLTGCAAAALGFQQQEPDQPTEPDEPQTSRTAFETSSLTPEELADWETRLNTTELNGFVSQMYGDIHNISLPELFYNHPGDPLTDSERSAFLAAWGMEPMELDLMAVTRQEAEDFLTEYTGLSLSDFPAGLDAQWTYSREKDRWFSFAGDTHFTPVTVTGGTRRGDTVVLNVEGQFSSGLTLGNLTITDGKFVSFSTPLYTTVENLAVERMNSAFAWLAKDYNINFTDRCLTGLTCIASIPLDDAVYTAWAPTYLLRPEDPSKVPLAGAMALENGWLLHYDGPGEPVLIVSTKDGQTQLREWADTSVQWEEGFTWEEWIVAHTHLGMDLAPLLNGWPEVTTDFLPSIAAGNEAWCTQWETTAERYLQQTGRTLLSDGLTVVRNFQPDYDGDQGLLANALCAEGEYLLFLKEMEYNYGDRGRSSVTFWQVLGEAAAGDTPSNRWTYSVDGPEALSFLAGDMDLAITNVDDILRETMTDDAGNPFEYMVYVCSPGAQVYVQNAGMFATEEGLYPDWAFDHAVQGRIDIVNDMEPLDIDENLIGVYDPESSLYVLKFEIAQ